MSPSASSRTWRDQLEVARHVEHADAGVRLLPKDTTPATLREAVRQTRARSAGARRVVEAFSRAGGAERAADVVEVRMGHASQGTSARIAAAA